MNSLQTRLVKMAERLRLMEEVTNLNDIKKLTRSKDRDKNDRSLLEATPTGIPGTWVESDGELIKTSKEVEMQ